MAMSKANPVDQRGVALAYLLWMLAGLSLLVSGVMTLSLSDVRATALQLDQARAQAVGTGVAHLLLMDMQQGDVDAANTAMADEAPAVAGAMFVREYQLGGYRAVARAIPLSGLVSLKDAPVALLAMLFEHAGGASSSAAAALAEAVVTWREQSDAEAGEEIPGGFLVVEDLLRVPGMTRSVYDRVRSLIHVQSTGASGIDPLAAPPRMIAALAGGDPALTQDVLDRRGSAAGDRSALPPGLADEHVMAGAGGGGYCLEVDVHLDDGRVLQQRIWVDMTSRSGAVPWRFTRVEPVLAVSPTGNEE